MHPDATDDQGDYTGHIRDRKTGLTYMQARYQDPLIGRFLSIDPVTFLDTGNPNFFNRYAYTFNDPINLTDPSGMCAEDGKSGFCPQDETAQKMFDQQMKDPHSSLPQAEKDAIESGTYIAVSSNEDFGGSSVGQNETSDGVAIPNSYGLSFAKQKGVFENSDGTISEQDSSPTEVFEHEVGHIVDIMSGAPLTDRTVDTIGYPDKPNEVSAINRTNIYRRNTGGPNARQRVCHSCSVGNAKIWKKYGSP
ncbi:RHS repeat-associated core domain-containing protein [Litorimonas sp. WD9-15]|uniref:RHS repeat-associated core domain-containing protein n=1 Tax=Litorimonas sp. WD9-15 TaxID=3418716 RepID=UPI003CFDD615